MAPSGPTYYRPFCKRWPMADCPLTHFFTHSNRQKDRTTQQAELSGTNAKSAWRR